MDGLCFGLPPSGLNRQLAAERAILRAGASRQRLPPPAGAHGGGLGGGLPRDLGAAEAESGWNTPNVNVRPRLHNKVISKARQFAGPLAPLPNGTGWGGNVPLVVDVRQCGVGPRLWEREAGLRYGRGETRMAPAAARRLPDAEDMRRPPMLKDMGMRLSEDMGRRRSEDGMANVGGAGGVRDSHDDCRGRAGRQSESAALGRGGASRLGRAALGTAMSNRLSMQVVSPTRHQLRQWKAMAGEEGGDSLEDEANALFNAYHGEIEPFSFQRVGSTGSTGATDAAHHAHQHAAERDREGGHPEKEVRLRVGRKGVSSARELKRSGFHTRGLAGAGLQGGAVGVGEGAGVGKSAAGCRQGGAAEKEERGGMARMQGVQGCGTKAHVGGGGDDTVRGERGATRGVM